MGYTELTTHIGSRASIFVPYLFGHWPMPSVVKVRTEFAEMLLTFGWKRIVKSKSRSLLEFKPGHRRVGAHVAPLGCRLTRCGAPRASAHALPEDARLEDAGDQPRRSRAIGLVGIAEFILQQPLSLSDTT